jgi:NADH-quinone oxidoreductase subunit L
MTLAALSATGMVAQEAEGFSPLLPGLILLLPLLGFAANGALALVSGSRIATLLREGREEEADTSSPPRPATHTLPTWIGTGVVGLAFLLTLVNFVAMLGTGLEQPVVRTYWTWMVTGTLTLDAAIQLDQLSMLMMMVVTGVGFLIHVFSVGYMRSDPGYPRYFA